MSFLSGFAKLYPSGTYGMQRVVDDLARVLVTHPDFRSLLKGLIAVREMKKRNYCPFLRGLPNEALSDRPIGLKLAREAVFAMAFRQSYPAPWRGQAEVAPFYRTSWIDKGPGRRRRIDAPRDCLKHLQEHLLNGLVKPELAACPGHVTCRSGSSAIHGAAMHVGARHLVNIDLKDFYPSIGAALAIKTLKKLGFGHWVSVLVGRLLTWQGFLPQGAPTSPALANLCFLPYDARIMELLGPGFTYTRYMDDITISITRNDARRLVVDDGQVIRRKVLLAIRHALGRSRFRINPSKTRLSVLGPRASGSEHLVTGYRVGNGEITLPKADRRFFRGLKKRIENCEYDLVRLANRPIRSQNSHPGKSVPPFAQVQLELAVRLLLKQHPGLQWVVPPPDEDKSWYRLLQNSWNGIWILASSEENPHQVIVRTRFGEPVGIVEDPAGRPDFLLLQKSIASSIVDLYFWLAGHAGRLHVPIALRPIAPKICSIWEAFRPVLDKLRVVAPIPNPAQAPGGQSDGPDGNDDPKPGTKPPKKSAKADLDGNPIGRLAVESLALWRDFLRGLGETPLAVSNLVSPERRRGLKRQATDAATLGAWLEDCNAVFITGARKLPLVLDGEENDPFRAILLAGQLLGGQRKPPYKFIGADHLGLGEGNQQGMDPCRFQSLVLGKIIALLKDEAPCTPSEVEKGHPRAWTQGLLENPWHKPGAASVAPEPYTIASGWTEDLARRFESVMGRLVPTGSPAIATELLADSSDMMRRAVGPGADSESCWQHLFTCCHALLSVVEIPFMGGASMRPGTQQSPLDQSLLGASMGGFRAMKLIRSLGGLASSTQAAISTEGWLQAQRIVAHRLGRVFHPKPANTPEPGNNQPCGLFPIGRHLELSPIELFEVKRSLFQDLILGLEALGRQSPQGAHGTSKLFPR